MINRNEPSVIVPLDTEGWGAILDLKEDERDFLVFPIPEGHLSILIRNGFFDAINSELDCWIDACEEESLNDPARVARLVCYLESSEFSKIIKERGTELEKHRAEYYRKKIILMAKKALRLKTPILFHF